MPRALILARTGLVNESSGDETQYFAGLEAECLIQVMCTRVGELYGISWYRLGSDSTPRTALFRAASIRG